VGRCDREDVHATGRAPARQSYGLNRLGRRDRDPGVEDVYGLFARLAAAGHQHDLAASDHLAGLAGWDIRPPEREPVVGQQGRPLARTDAGQRLLGVAGAGAVEFAAATWPLRTLLRVSGVTAVTSQPSAPHGGEVEQVVTDQDGRRRRPDRQRRAGDRLFGRKIARP